MRAWPFACLLCTVGGCALSTDGLPRAEQGGGSNALVDERGGGAAGSAGALGGAGGASAGHAGGGGNSSGSGGNTPQGGGGGGIKAGGSGGSSGRLDGGIPTTPDAQTSAPADAGPVDAAPPDVRVIPVALTIGAIADTYAQGSGPDGTFTPDGVPVVVDNSSVNFGAEPWLLVKYRPYAEETFFWRESFVAFDVDIAAGLKRATLILNAGTSQADASLVMDVHAVDNAWNETALTWADRPALGELVARAEVAPTKATVPIDVTSHVLANQGNGQHRIAFGLAGDPATPLSSSARIEIDSRESGDAGPRLLLEF